MYVAAMDSIPRVKGYTDLCNEHGKKVHESR